MCNTQRGLSPIHRKSHNPKRTKPVFTRGLYKEVDEVYVKYLLENLKNIGNKDLTYKNKIMNTFFAKDFADKEIERLQMGNLASLDTRKNSTKLVKLDKMSGVN